MIFNIEYRPDLVTPPFAQLWATERFAIRDDQRHTVPCELKGDELGIGCVYKIDLWTSYWAGWEGTDLADGTRLLWVVPADRTDMPPAPHLRLIERGVNIARWIEGEPEPEPLPEPEPEPTPDPEPEPEPPGHPPYTPDPVNLPMVTVLCGTHVDRTVVTFWGTEDTPGREVVFSMPEAEYMRIFGESGLARTLTWLREQVDAGDYELNWRIRH